MTLSELLRAMKELLTTASCRNSRGSSTVTFFDWQRGAPLGAGDFEAGVPGAEDLVAEAEARFFAAEGEGAKECARVLVDACTRGALDAEAKARAARIAAGVRKARRVFAAENRNARIFFYDNTRGAGV